MKSFVILRADGSIRRLVQGGNRPRRELGRARVIEVDLPEGVSVGQLRHVDGRIEVMDAAPGPRRAVTPVDDRPAREQVRAERTRAFAERSDPLIGPLLRGEITPEEFAAIAAQIRAEHPYPEKDQ